MTYADVDTMPDIESALLYVLVPMEPDVRFVTVMPAGDLPMITARILRVSGALTRSAWIDAPVVDIDVWGQKGVATLSDVSIVSRNIQSDMTSLMSAKVMNGVIQSVTVVSGPRRIQEVNPNLVRYSASYQVRIHP